MRETVNCLYCGKNIGHGHKKFCNRYCFHRYYGHGEYMIKEFNELEDFAFKLFQAVQKLKKQYYKRYKVAGKVVKRND